MRIEIKPRAKDIPDDEKARAHLRRDHDEK